LTSLPPMESISRFLMLATDAQLRPPGVATGFVTGGSGSRNSPALDAEGDVGPAGVATGTGSESLSGTRAGVETAAEIGGTAPLGVAGGMTVETGTAAGSTSSSICLLCARVGSGDDSGEMDSELCMLSRRPKPGTRNPLDEKRAPMELVGAAATGAAEAEVGLDTVNDVPVATTGGATGVATEAATVATGSGAGPEGVLADDAEAALEAVRDAAACVAPTAVAVARAAAVAVARAAAVAAAMGSTGPDVGDGDLAADAGRALAAPDRGADNAGGTVGAGLVTTADATDATGKLGVGTAAGAAEEVMAAGA
jgi:hypothetical protein